MTVNPLVGGIPHYEQIIFILFACDLSYQLKGLYSHILRLIHYHRSIGKNIPFFSCLGPHGAAAVGTGLFLVCRAQHLFVYTFVAEPPGFNI